MSNQEGVLYTEHSDLVAILPGIASLWSFETRSCERGRPRIRRHTAGYHEYWLDRSDPLLNTILPGTGVSLVVNFGDLWAAGRSLATSSFLPRICVVGPVTQKRLLRVGRFVHAIGAGLPSTWTPAVFGVPAVELVDRIVPLQDLWSPDNMERLFATPQLDIRRSVSALKDELIARIGEGSRDETVGHAASRLIELHSGRVSILGIARTLGLSRQEFSGFRAAAGLPPKLFARITRFQALVHALLVTDVAQWASMSSAIGYYDQAHMINEFREFSGSPPRIFFQPHGSEVEPARIQMRGRPSEWLGEPACAEKA
jgi:AraC-like DNA-binding protein